MKIPVKSISEGLKNYIFQDKNIEILAGKRARICDKCVYKSGYRCEKCSCILVLKIRSLTEKCLIGLW